MPKSIIKSNNYVMLEAGKGKATVPLERYSKRYQDFKKMETDAQKMTDRFIEEIDKVAADKTKEIMTV